MSPIWDLPEPDLPSLAGGSGGGGGTAPGAAAARGELGLWDLRFDPITQDLIDDGAGAYELTTTAETAVLHQALCHYDAWWGDPQAGSRFHELEQFAADPAPLIEDEGRRCFGVLVDAGLIADVDVAAAESKAGRVDVETKFRDVKTGLAVNLAVTPAGA